ncbi:MAG TPA: ATP-binding protein [Thermomicrobiales bacterium]|nr:ATP-binding protein [Thermomicrobiales bacterium]
MLSQVLDTTDYAFNWTALPVLATGIVMASLGVVVAIQERGSRVSLAFLFLTSTAALWLLGVAAMYSTPREATAWQWARIVQVGVVLIPSAILIFTLAVVQRFRRFRAWAWVSIACSVLAYLGVMLTDQFTTGVRRYSWGFYPQYGPLSVPFLVFFAASTAFSLYLYWAGYRQSPPGSSQQGRLRAFLVALGVGYVGSVDFLAAYGVPLYPFGYIPVGVFIVLSTRAIRRYHLVDITPAFAVNHILAIMADALVVLDRDGVIRVVNPAAGQLFGKPEAELVGVPIAAVDDRFLPPQHAEALLGGERSANYEVDLPAARGGLRTFGMAASLLRDATGQPAAIVCLAHDLTRRKRIEEEIRELNTELERRVDERTAQLEAANRELEAFSYSVSHDLRAPLRSISGFSQILLEDYPDKLDAEGRDALRRIQAAVQRMGRLIDALLALSRVTRSELHRQPVDLSDLVRDVAAELQAGEPGRQVALVIQPGLVVSGDRQLLRVALANLLDNAWKFSARRADARIEVGAERRDGKWCYFVRDNGIGFDMADADRVFQPFQRLHDPAEFPGTGIGLATAQRIIRRHNGQIWAEAAEGRGAAFYFTL